MVNRLKELTILEGTSDDKKWLRRFGKVDLVELIKVKI